MTVSETMVETSAPVVPCSCAEGWKPEGWAYCAGCYEGQIERLRAALTAALSDQVVVPKDEYDSLMKRDAAMAQVLTLARELGEVTRRLDIVWKENRKLVRLNKKLSAAPPPSSTAGEG